MKNCEKYKTADERWRAFIDFCDSRDCSDCELQGRNNCVFSWLELEAPEEKPLPCPFCGSECDAKEFMNINWAVVACENQKCHYTSGDFETKKDAIAAHNRVAKAVMAAKEGVAE